MVIIGRFNPPKQNLFGVLNSFLRVLSSTRPKVLGFVSYLTKVLKCASVNINDEVATKPQRVQTWLKHSDSFLVSSDKSFR